MSTANTRIATTGPARRQNVAKRKSVRETRLEEWVLGFEACLFIFKAAWRKETWADVENGQDAMVKLWPLIEKAELVMRVKNREWNALYAARHEETKVTR